jgi:hypothetical protein
MDKKDDFCLTALAVCVMSHDKYDKSKVHFTTQNDG